MQGKLYLAVVLVTAVMLLPGCKEASNPVTPLPEKFSELKPSSAFNWRTFQAVQLKVTGIETVVPVSGTLKVLTPDGQTLLAVAHTLNQDFEAPVFVPAHITTIKVTFGSIERVATVTRGPLTVALAPPFDNGESN